MAGGSRASETLEFKRLLRNPSVTTPSKFVEGKKQKRGEAEDSDAEASFVADTQTASGVGGSRLDKRKNKRRVVDDNATASWISVMFYTLQAMANSTLKDTIQGEKTGATTKCKSRNATKGVAFTSRGAEVSYHNIDAPSYQYVHCNVSMWYEERINKGNRAVNPSFALCCQEGKLWLPKFNLTPQPLHNLLNYNNPATTQQYNKPTVAEVAALITNDFGDGIPSRDIIVNKLHSGPKRISELHPTYMGLQYPLLFLYGEEGFHDNIPYYINRGNQKTNCGFVIMKEYYSYIIQQRNDQGNTLVRGGRLFQQYLVDAYSAVEEQCLKWTRNNQDTLRVDLYHNVCDAVTRGDTNAAGLVVYVIEFQKRGFPHAHILLWLKDNSKCKTAAQIDDIILAELPSPTDNPDGYKAVTDYMLHVPCETVLDEDGYPIYRHQENKASFKKGKFTFDNRHMVPHSRYLLLKYQEHINVEWCNKSKAIKYLFKYLNKGPDRATIVIKENVQKGDHVTSEKVVAVDEINNYLNCRYLAPCEAVRRLFSFDIDYSYPFVMKLNFHLPNQNPVTLRDFEFILALLEREGINITMFTDWFDLNERDPSARKLTYADLPKLYVWHEQLKMWKPRKQKNALAESFTQPQPRESVIF
ncbi:ATP-dependent DNA helicase PIF1 [Tanacetum coccineum]